MCRGLKSSLQELLHLRKGIWYKNGLLTADLDSNPVLAIEFLTEDIAYISMGKQEGVFANCVCTFSTLHQCKMIPLCLIISCVPLQTLTSLISLHLLLKIPCFYG